MFGPNLNNVGIRPQDLKAFHDAGYAYESAMADLREQLEKYEQPLPKIAADIEQRASVLQRAGKNLEDAFWAIIQSPVGGLPLVYHEAVGIYNVSTVFQGLGDIWGASPPRSPHGRAGISTWRSCWTRSLPVWVIN